MHSLPPLTTWDRMALELRLLTLRQGMTLLSLNLDELPAGFPLRKRPP